MWYIKIGKEHAGEIVDDITNIRNVISKSFTKISYQNRSEKHAICTKVNNSIPEYVCQKFINIVKKMEEIVTKDKILYEFLFTAPNYIQDSQKQTWKTYQERLYSILQSIIEDGIKKKEFVDLNPGLLMKAIGGLFHQLLISNDEQWKEKELEIMLKNFLKPNKV